jgi:hypothetical protein
VGRNNQKVKDDKTRCDYLSFTCPLTVATGGIIKVVSGVFFPLLKYLAGGKVKPAIFERKRIMCQFRSGKAIHNITTNEVSLKLMPCEDSHTKIGEYFHIPENDCTPLTQHSTSLEYIPCGGIDEWDKYRLIFGEGKPSWWQDEFTEQVIRDFQTDLKEYLKTKKLKWNGDLCLGNLTSTGELTTLTSDGYLYLRSLTSTGELTTLTSDGYLCLGNLTSTGELTTLTSGGYLYLRSLTSTGKLTIKAKAIFFNGKWHGGQA